MYIRNKPGMRVAKSENCELTQVWKAVDRAVPFTHSITTPEVILSPILGTFIVATPADNAVSATLLLADTNIQAAQGNPIRGG
jgi:hypothetical protein